MTSQAPSTARPVMVAAFPGPGRLVTHAYRELQIAATGTKEQLKALARMLHGGLLVGAGPSLTPRWG